MPGHDRPRRPPTPPPPPGAWARLQAAEPIGLLQAVRTLTQWLALNRDGNGVPGIRIDDHPDFAPFETTLREQGQLLDR